MKKFTGLRSKTYSYLINNGSDKKEKGTKKCAIKRKLKFEYYQNCLEATQFDNRINDLEKNNIDIHNVKKNHKEFIKKL